MEEKSSEGRKKDKRKHKTIMNIIFIVVLIIIVLVVWYVISHVLVPNATGAAHIQNFFETAQEKLSGG